MTTSASGETEAAAATPFGSKKRFKEKRVRPRKKSAADAQQVQAIQNKISGLKLVYKK